MRELEFISGLDRPWFVKSLAPLRVALSLHAFITQQENELDVIGLPDFFDRARSVGVV